MSKFLSKLAKRARKEHQALSDLKMGINGFLNRIHCAFEEGKIAEIEHNNNKEAILSYLHVQLLLLDLLNFTYSKIKELENKELNKGNNFIKVEKERSCSLEDYFENDCTVPSDI